MSTIQDVLEGRARWCVVHGDNREVLADLPAGAMFDHCIGDPPYSEHTHAKVRRGGSVHAPDAKTGPKRPVISTSTVLGFDAIDEDLRAAVAGELAMRVKRWVVLFSDAESVHRWSEELVASGLEHVRTGAWVKVGATPQFTGDRPGIGFESIEIAHRPGRKRWNGGGTHALWTFGVEQGERLHTTQKPLDLMLRLIELFTDPDDLILDPFCGSGTTGQAALQLGRRFIGIEADARYAAVATARLEGGARVESLRDARTGQRGLFEVSP